MGTFKARTNELNEAAAAAGVEGDTVSGFLFNESGTVQTFPHMMRPVFVTKEVFGREEFEFNTAQEAVAKGIELAKN